MRLVTHGLVPFRLVQKCCVKQCVCRVLSCTVWNTEEEITEECSVVR